MRLLDRLIRRDGYWEGLSSNAAVLTTSYGQQPDREQATAQFVALVQQAYQSNGAVFAAGLARMMLLSEARFVFQRASDKGTYGNESLRILEEPWPGGTSGDLLGRMEQDAYLAGQAYVWNAPGEDLLVRLRPEWTVIVSELVTVPGGGRYRRKIGFWVDPPKTEPDWQPEFYPADEVVHWAPLPDPTASFRGMSPLTPVLREIQADTGMTSYKVKYLENAASPNMLIRYTQKLQPGTIDSLRERMAARYGGAGNAFKTLVLDQGADATVIGSNLQQMDFANVQGASSDRILAAAQVPGILVGLEPLRGAGRGYEESLRRFADLWARPQWRSACGALQRVVSGVPPKGVRLWYDTSDIAALQDGEMARSQATLVRAQGILALNQTNRYDPQSIIDAVEAADLTLLKPAPQMPAAAAGQPVQHLLPQQQPGITADPLPATMPRLPVGSVSPGDGGNGTRPTMRPTSARRNGHG